MKDSIYENGQVLFVKIIRKLSYATVSSQLKTRAWVIGVRRTLCSFLAGDEMKFCLLPKMSCTNNIRANFGGVSLNMFAVYCQRVIDSNLTHVQAS